MKDNFNLTTVLEHVANGKTPVSKAKNIIEKYFLDEIPRSRKTVANSEAKKSQQNKYEETKNVSEFYSSANRLEGGKEKLLIAFDKLKKTVNLEELLKKSTQLVHQISENLPQKIQENFMPIGFSANTEGVESKLSVFRAMQVSADNIVNDNQVVGCQWFEVSLLENCEIKHNKFMATQFNQFSLTRSDFCDSHISLSRMSEVTLQEVCFGKNKVSLSTWSDVSITESDFTQNVLSRSNFSGTVINGSRLSHINMMNVDFKDCEFDSCDIQGIMFSNCEFRDCTFSHIVAVETAEPVKVSDCRLIGKQFSDCTTVQEFLELLKK